jgi:hypothetical protein
MRKNVVLLAVIASLGIAVVAMDAGAETPRGGATLSQRVADLEDRADRQAHAIAELRTENARQQTQIAALTKFKQETLRWKAGITKKTSKLRSTGRYVGPVDNGQVQVGQGASACANQLARWNATAKSLGCETT